ncbi:MAG: hypothetical protein GF383_10880 [Candidatus Lokiarchaeota archaeon]|nr:hypothetical protein [Candidatus Lokiarchaeota archaeon]MBD3341112.1 hypothetical protein [Candidatus Lokiarchaeota archaeon]
MIKNMKNRENIKIVVAGLDNAGKTSFIIALRHKYNFYERVKDLKPTIKIDYNSFEFLNKWSINLWDMGGQAKYRKIYVNNPIYFIETDFVYFFIDIQDELKIEESMKYLHELIKIFNENGYSNEIIVCFNKHDPQFRCNQEFADRVEMIKNLVLVQNKNFKFKFFKTSIYDVSSLSKAMSYSLNKLLNLNEINQYLEFTVKDFKCQHAVLYTDTGLIISDYYNNEIMDNREFDDLIGSKVSNDLEFFQRLNDNKVNIDERISIVDENMEYVKKYEVKIDSSKNTFYLRLTLPIEMVHEMKKNANSFHKILSSFLG